MPFTKRESGLLDRHLRLLNGRYIVNAITTAAKIAEAAMKDHMFCVVVNLDVRNAFICAKYSKIIEASTKLGGPKYLVRIVKGFHRGYYATIESRAVKASSNLKDSSRIGPRASLLDNNVRWNLGIAAWHRTLRKSRSSQTR